ncbi:hypothetical protein [Cupriavidus nantongensis]|uniref:hypothetical protein n=1 Tax=Cupriavidus nantongensis TaxID=1796606 RepID=UPI002245AD51|nr:hypothetical protein [Cupriavidus nantongensis]
MRSPIWRLLLIPSTYGVLVWSGLLSLLAFDFIAVDVSATAYYVYLYVIICFVLSNALISRLFLAIDLEGLGRQIEVNGLDMLLFVVSTLIGLAGLGLYILDFSANFGGVYQFFYIFLTNPLEIRAAAADSTSFGFQISYFSWLSVFYCVLLLATGYGKSMGWKIFLALLGVFEFALNLLFIDRTRPTILFVICALGFVACRFGRFRHPLRFLVAVFLGPLVIFFAQALYTGKYDASDGLLNNFMVYILGGFGYFSSLLSDVIPDYSFARTFYPVAKIFEVLGLMREVPPQILEFRDIPFLTNVGTFLEPFVSDGGLMFLLVGVPSLAVTLDLFALLALRMRSIPGLFIWANFILIALLSFFVPKYNATHTYLFIAIFLGFQLMRASRSIEVRG